ncbi:hypothetical protein FRC05_005976 [Tulasnella sp. 425]|nr:hypothetical protein FRC05_005976 [Tulasnella sp. 425]
MAHIRLPVATVAQTGRHGISNNHTPTATSASAFTPNVSTDRPQIDFDHGQGSLFEVPSLPPPSLRRSAAVISVPRRVPRNVHVPPRVARVPPGFVVNEASATKRIENVENTAWGMFNKWPLNAIFKLVGGRDPEPEEPAPQVNAVPEEEEMTDGGPPPPYDAPQTISLGDNKSTTTLSKDSIDCLSMS